MYGGDDPIGRNAKGERMECYNLTLVGYAPYDNPEVAFSVVVPWLHNDKSGINSIIGKEVLDVYFDLKSSVCMMKLLVQILRIKISKICVLFSGRAPVCIKAFISKR